MAALLAEIEELERRLQEASKARESRLRKAGAQGRARLAAELRQMDAAVAAVSRALAVRTLQLELEHCHACLEAEALDVLGDPAAAGSRERAALALARRGSSGEIALLAAEFEQLDAELSALAAEVEGAGGAPAADDGELWRLATEIPDLRQRLGLGEETVFGGAGLSLARLQGQARAAAATVAEGVSFGVRGVRLLAGDVGAAGRLFWRAALGGTLRPREASALRRTAVDVLTFVPFVIILVLPLTPVGHVLIFGFIQRYFPGLFPSQFTNRRQELMIKYEELKRALQEAEAAYEIEAEERAFARAAAATAAALEQVKAGGAAAAAAAADGAAAPAADAERGAGAGGGARAAAAVAAEPEDGEPEGPAAAAVRRLEEQLAAAASSSYAGDETDEGEGEGDGAE
jgi:hypothetical protein